MIARFMALFSNPMASGVEFFRRHDQSFVAQTAALVHQGVNFSVAALHWINREQCEPSRPGSRLRVKCEIVLRVKSNLLNGIKLISPSSPISEIFRFTILNYRIISLPVHSTEGRYANVTSAGLDAMDAKARETRRC
jgi:hypothetical protein